jgi:hypothetical protein
VTTVRLADGVRGRTSATGRGILLHVPSADALLSIPQEWHPLLDGRLHAVGGLWENFASAGPAATTLVRLAAHGAVTFEPAGAPGEHRSLWYAAHPHEVADSRADGSCLLTSPETGNRVRVSAAGRLLWLLAAGGATAADLSARSRLRQEQLRPLLKDLIRHHVIAVASLHPELLGLPLPTAAAQRVH